MQYSDLHSLPLIGRGKVRDLYEVDDDRLLIIQSDRTSAFDVVLKAPVPNKGCVLTAMSLFWFERLRPIVKNHLLSNPPESVVAEDEISQIANRAMVVKKFKPLPIEAVCRGYLIGSGWRDYQKTGKVCGLLLPANLSLAAKLPETIFTPATKAEQGRHDENISYEQMANIIGEQTAQKVKEITLQLYETAAQYAFERGIIIADTKFEFALDDHGDLVLIDEALTPDSSRFWDASLWQPGQNPDSYDKQIIRDFLSGTAWNQQPPPPSIPDFILTKTAARYIEIQNKLLSS